MKKIIMFGLIAATVILSGCNKDKVKEPAEAVTDTITIEDEAENREPIIQPSEETAGNSEPEAKNESETSTDDGFSGDFFKDYDPQIEADVKNAIESASSLQAEIDNVQKVAAKYSLMASKAETQAEMNMASKWSYTIWDKELNSLWSRISNTADEQTKERLLADQRNWVSMKEEVKLENIGSMEDGGSMYPMNENGFFEGITFNRVCILANELAKIKGETYNMPPRSMYGTYVDDQGSGEVYSSLITRTGMELDNEALISIYRLGGIEGTFKEIGDGEYEFVSYGENVKGIIKMNGWENASFEVTESADSPFTVGEKFEFDFAF
ncbi:MAG: DUF1311 domain-containing protein [Lachnospiraceae bacterium]|nr:DUF1311 domain-containing protein [Lachnospiraceae bacterium]